MSRVNQAVESQRWDVAVDDESAPHWRGLETLIETRRHGRNRRNEVLVWRALRLGVRLK